jgi:hypothetical protein
VDVVWIVEEPAGAGPSWLRDHVAALEPHGVRSELATARAVRPGQRFDVAIATSAAAVETAFGLDAARRAWLVWDAEDRRPEPGSPERAGARLALDLPLTFLTATPAATEALAVLRPDAPRHDVRLGVDKALYRPAENGGDGGTLRIVAADDGAREASARTTEPHTVTLAPDSPEARAALYAQTDVVLALEPHADPLGPLPAFHAGATVVAAELGAPADLVHHGVDGLLCEPGDARGPARQLDLLARDRALLRRLREGALSTAAAWPSVDEAAVQLAAVLEAIAHADPPDPAPALARLLADLRGLLEEQRSVVDERDALARRLEPVERLVSSPAVGRLLAIRRRRR